MTSLSRERLTASEPGQQRAARDDLTGRSTSLRACRLSPAAGSLCFLVTEAEGNLQADVLRLCFVV